MPLPDALSNRAASRATACAQRRPLAQFGVARRTIRQTCVIVRPAASPANKTAAGFGTATDAASPLAVVRLVASKLAFGIAACLVFCSCGEPPAPPDVTRARISGGHAAPTGAWPNVVWLDNGCTGVLVDPDIVVYAAHCGTDVMAVWSGDRVDVVVDEAAKTIVTTGSSGGMRYPIKSCTAHPEWDLATGNDMAFCVLATAAQQDYAHVPTTCNVDSVTAGTPTMLVGFGYDGDELPGIKRVANLTVTSVGPELRIGDEVAGTCAGDSGSPAFTRINDEWRLLGILSSGVQGQPCGPGYYTRADILQQWLEAAADTTVGRCDGEPTQQNCNRPLLDEEGKRIDASTSPDMACADAAQIEPSEGCSVARRVPRGSASVLASCLLAFWGLWRRRVRLRPRRRAAGAKQRVRPPRHATASSAAQLHECGYGSPRTCA